MKEFFIVLIAWLLWFFLIFPPINNAITTKQYNDSVVEYNDMVTGNYTTDSIIKNNYGNLNNIYEIRNLEISFANGVYKVNYEVYAKCHEYYTSTNQCIDNEEKKIDEVNSNGNYEIKDNKLYLYLYSSTTKFKTTRICNITNKYIDCTSSGGWYYMKK